MNKQRLAFTLCLALLATGIGLVGSRLASPSFLTLILTGVTAATWLVYVFVEKADREQFIRNYLLTIVVKLLAGGIFISTLLYLDKEGAEANAIFFMTTYFLLTGLEVAFLFGSLK